MALKYQSWSFQVEASNGFGLSRFGCTPTGIVALTTVVKLMVIPTAISRNPRRIHAVSRTATRGHSQPFAEQRANDRFLICKRTFGETSSNDRFWPTPAARLAGVPMAGIDPTRSLTSDDANVRFQIARQTLSQMTALCIAAMGCLVAVHGQDTDTSFSRVR